MDNSPAAAEIRVIKKISNHDTAFMRKNLTSNAKIPNIKLDIPLPPLNPNQGLNICPSTVAHNVSKAISLLNKNFDAKTGK